MKALLTVNPVSGKKRITGELVSIISRLEKGGYTTTVHVTDRRGDAAETARLHGGEYDVIICCGGDGTLSETVNGMIAGGHKTKIGYIPSGTTNDFANGIGLSPDTLRAADDIVTGQPKTFDIGRFNEREFMYIASFGAFTQSSYGTPQNLKNTFGHFAYILSGIKELAEIKPYHMSVYDAEGILHEGDYIFGAACNATSVGGIIKLDKRLVDLSDGVFEVMLVRCPKTPVQISLMAKALLNGNYDNEFLDFFHTKRLDIHCDEALPWSLDGEEAEGRTDTEIEVLHEAVSIILPSSGEDI